MIINKKKGNLLNATEKFIVQQCNCVTTTPHGLSKTIADRFPWADVYRMRPIKSKTSKNTAHTPETPGTIAIFNGPAELAVICMFAQWAPGKIGDWSWRYQQTYDDNSASQREQWFIDCLKLIDDDPTINSPVACPYNIGCGLAGGNWRNYKAMLKKAKTEFVIYKL